MTEERRLVTILFADVTGSTALGESLDPEDLRALLGRYYAIARDIVEGYGGTLEKFIGDAVMAVFGLPSAHGDDAARALSAALELRDRVRADANLGERLPIRLGVASGEVVASREAAEGGDFMVTGDAVNVAARLQQAAEPWAILVAERTAQSAREFTFGAPESITAKGKAAPIPAVRLVGRAVDHAGREGRVPLLGREADLAQLELVARRVFRERRPFLVSLVAPAGTGKTRLLEEFLDRLRSLEPAANVAISQCLPYGQRLTYWPLLAVLGRLAGIDEDAAPETIRRRLQEWLSGLGDEAAARDAEHLAATVGAGEAGVGESTAVVAAWKSAIELAAAHEPLVIVFEDLHWSSDSLLDLVEAILQPRGDLPLLMIALTRPELLDRRPRWGGGRRDYISLSLEPLDDDSVATLVRHLLEGAPRELVAAIVDRADGNPFFAGEIVRSIADRLGPRGAQDTDPAILRETLPDSVQATVLARLDTLPPDERRVLQVGAVFGRSFRPGGVAAVEPALGERTAAAVQLLVDRDLIRPSGTDGFAFRHILIREVAYQTLPRGERARLHAAAGHWLEARAADREELYAELIAYHYRESAALGSALDPAATVEVRARAVTWLSRAAEVAMAAGAQLEAARHLRAAIELAPPELLPELYERLALTWGNGNQVVEALEIAIRLAREQGRPPEVLGRLQGQLLLNLMRFYGGIPRRPSDAEMDRLRAEGRRLAAVVGDDLVRARLLIAEGFVPFYYLSRSLPLTDEQRRAAEHAAREGLAIAEREDDAELISTALDALTSFAQQRGDWAEARRNARQRLTLEGRIGLGELLDADSMVAWTAASVGDPREAIAVAEHRLSNLRPGQMPSTALHLTSWQIYALGMLGRWDEALGAARRALALWLEIDQAPAGYALGGFVTALVIARGRRDEGAEDAVSEPIQALLETFEENPRNRLARAIVGRRQQPDVASLVAAAPLGSDAAERALAIWSDQGVLVDAPTLEELARAAERSGLRPLWGQLLRALGLARREPTALRDALGVLEGIEARPAVARVQVELGMMTDAQALVGDGLRALRELGDLEQLDRYEAAAR